MKNATKKDLAVIHYLGHSGWAVKTVSHFLIFDYYEGNRTSDMKNITNGFINPYDIKNENVFVFISHRHSDHYDKIIKTWNTIIPNITYVAGWNSKRPNLIGIPPHSTRKIENLTIDTLKATDEGSGFLISVDDLLIFHGGDHANWQSPDCDDPYNTEIDYISSINSNIDLAFIPVTTFNGVRRKSITDGAIYALQKLKPSVVFPMHGNGREYLYKEFSKEDIVKDYNIFCPDKLGDSYTYIKE